MANLSNFLFIFFYKQHTSNNTGRRKLNKITTCKSKQIQIQFNSPKEKVNYEKIYTYINIYVLT